MKPTTKLHCLRNSTFIGCFLSLCAGTVSWYWGNLRVYTDSYFRAKLGPDSGYDTPWVVALSVVGYSGGVLFAGMTGKSLDRRLKIGTAGIVFTLAMGLNYFAAQKSVAALVFLCGPVIGFASGYVYGNVLEIIRILSDQKRVGFYTGAVTSAKGIGPLLFTQIITFYINPDNQATNLRTVNRAYFTQDDILDRVPSVFLVLSGIILSFNVLGLLLMRDTSNVQFLEQEIRITAISQDAAYHNPSTEKSHGNQMDNGISEDRDSYGKRGESQNGKTLNGRETYDPPQIKQTGNAVSEDTFFLKQQENNDKSLHTVTVSGKDQGNSAHVDSEANTSGDLSPREALKTSTFYIMFSSSFIAALCYNVMANYVKVYGQLWISDDHFLANLEAAILIGFVAMRILGGFCVDRFGFKYSITMQLSVISIGMALLYFAVMVNKWFYFVWAAVTGAFTAAFFFVYSIGALKMFGRTHYIKNVGLIIGGGALPVNLAGPLLINYILQSAGWFPLFFICSALAAVCLLFTVLFLPKSEKY